MGLRNVEQHNELHCTGLRPPTFRLSSLLAVMAIICTCLALLRLFDPIWAGMFMLFLLIIFAHVAGNALGTQLRDNAHLSRPLDYDRPDTDQRRIQPANESLFAPSTRLSLRTRLGLWTIIPTGIGVLGGAVGGGWLLWWSMQGQASIGSMALGVVSCGVLGGLWGFWISSFLSVLGSAVWHAHRESND